jgi:hypothetical protein
MFNTLAIKEMQIKTTLRFHLTPVDWSSSRKQTTRNADEDVGIKEPSYTISKDVN